MIKRLYKNSFDKRNYWETSEMNCVMTTQLKIGSINILRLVLTVAAGIEKSFSPAAFFILTQQKNVG